ncbi:hypothetical protein V6N12_042599 [Hibiscus sabdariffa]|uniref:RNase H type-1 domain-containing protein n=1 Tax=Hibiscus sabdariffa TaxID=183260 RepID=A0ABR2EFM3_9ROSI
MGVETMTHVFRDCAKAKEILTASDIPFMIRDSTSDGIKDWILEAKTSLDNAGFTNFMVVLWGIWNSRNSKVFDNETCSARATAEKAKALNAGNIDRSGRGLARLRKKPGPRVIKINVNGAYNETTGRGAIGIIARDWNGDIQASGAKMIQSPCSPNLAEAEAFLAGVVLATAKGWKQVVLEGDAIEIVNRLANSILDFSALGTQLKPVREATKNFIFSSFLYVNRIGNKIAHELAHWALGNSHDMSFEADYPDLIRGLVVNDSLNN